MTTLSQGTLEPPARHDRRIPRFSRWTPYDPFLAEARAAYKRLEGRLSRRPAFPQIFVLPLFSPDFHQPCGSDAVERALARMPPEDLVGLRAVFLLGGNRRQRRPWQKSLGCYGLHWQGCIFLCAHHTAAHGEGDGGGGFSADDLRRFYLDEVLVHEVAHHVDGLRAADNNPATGGAVHAFVQERKARGLRALLESARRRLAPRLARVVGLM